MSLYKLLFFVLIYINIHTRAQWNITTVSTPSLPRRDYAQAVGYYNGTIYIFGGYDYPNAWIEYIASNNTMIDRGVNQLPYISSESGQYYTQMNDKLYWIHYNTIYFYDYIFQNFTNFATTPKRVDNYACLTSYNNLLFVLGGIESMPIQTAQVFNISNSEWIQIADLNRHRREPACAVDARRGIVYVIAGGSNGLIDGIVWRPDFETFVICDNITESEWMFNQSQALDYASWGVRALYVEYNDSILVVGGATVLPDISIIDCETRKVFAVSKLNYSSLKSGIVSVSGVLYLFGGWKSGSYYNSWQRITNPLVFGETSMNVVEKDTLDPISRHNISRAEIVGMYCSPKALHIETTQDMHHQQTTIDMVSKETAIYPPNATDLFGETEAEETTNTSDDDDNNEIEKAPSDSRDVVAILIVIILSVGIIAICIFLGCFRVYIAKKAKDALRNMHKSVSAVEQSHHSQANSIHHTPGYTSGENGAVSSEITPDFGPGVYPLSLSNTSYLDNPRFSSTVGNKQAEGVQEINIEMNGTAAMSVINENEREDYYDEENEEDIASYDATKGYLGEVQYANDEEDGYGLRGWNTIQTLNWILSIENGAFKEYEHTLTQELFKGQLKGEDLIIFDTNDFISLGIVTLEHRKLLKRNILECIRKLTSDQESNSEDEEAGAEKEQRHETKRKSAVKLQMVGANDNNIEKEDVILDQMLSDIVEMQNLDPNKIHQINVNNVVNQNNNDSDSDDSDHMYQNHK